MNSKRSDFTRRIAAVILLAAVCAVAAAAYRSVQSSAKTAESPKTATLTENSENIKKKTGASLKNDGNSSEEIALKTEKRGYPLLNLQNGRKLETRFSGANALNAAETRPAAMISADLNSDGAADLIVGYAGVNSGGSRLAIYQGNPDSLSARTSEAFEDIKQGRFPAPFLSTANLIELPAAPDFIGAGDFNRDGFQDILTAARGDDSLVLLAGNSKGGYSAQNISLPGRVTALLTEKIDPADAQTDAAVALTDENGASWLFVFDNSRNAFAAQPKMYRLPAAANSLALGQLDDAPPLDILAAAGGRAVIIHGAYAGKSEENRQNESAATSARQVETLSIGENIAAVRIGNFVWDRENRAEIAAVSESGEIRILQRGKLDVRPYSEDEMEARLRAQEDADQKELAARRGSASNNRKAGAAVQKQWRRDAAQSWSEADSFQLSGGINLAADAPASIFTSARMTSLGVDDLIIADAVGKKIKVLLSNDDLLKASGGAQSLSAKGERAAIEFDAAPAAAVLPMRLGLTTRPGLVTLAKDTGEITYAAAAPVAIFTVTTTTDTSDGVCDANCSLRDAIRAANATPNVADLVLVPAGTYTLTIGPSDDSPADPSRQQSGDLDIRDDLTITGAGQATTIIQAGTSPSNGIDRVFHVRQAGAAVVDLSISGVTIRNGRCDTSGSVANPNGARCNTGGAGLFITGQDTAVYSISDSTVTSNWNVTVNAGTGKFFLNGAGIYVGRGDATLTNVTVSNNENGADNSNLGGDGGGLLFGFSSAANVNTATLNNCSVTGNVTRTLAGTLGGLGGGLNTAYDVTTINGGDYSNNSADLDGGAFYLLTATTISNATVNNNSAHQNGGGIYSNAFDSSGNPLTNTVTNATMKGNKADSNNAINSAAGEVTRGDGGAIYNTFGALDISDSTIGGSGAGEANSAFNGGGIHNNSGTTTIGLGVTVANNTAAANGGGISNAGNLSALTDAAITGNTAAGNGGGIFNSGTLGTLTNPSLNNNAAATGGGIFSSNGALTISNGTINGNTATTGKGGGIEHSGSAASNVSFVVISGNTGSGINVTGAGSLDAKSNTITGNSGDGITMTGSGTGSNFESNTVHSNGELGIDLSDNGVTANDANDADAGPNNLQNFPEINYVRNSDDTANVTLNAANGSYRIQYYANTTCDASGNGEGELFLTSQDITITSGNTLTFTSPALNFGAREQITATATHDANNNGDFDDDGSTSEFSACRKVNTLPTISAQAATRQQGSPVSSSTVATVADPDQAANTLTVTVNGGATATANGVTISNVTVDASGNVTANIIADCTATTASFTLRVTDNATEFNEAALNVTVNPNTAPTVGNYPNTAVNAGANTTVTPDAAPSDNGSIASVTASASAGFTGTFVGNTTTGAVTINNAAPFGTYTVTVTTTDNCGATTQKTFQLTVNAVPTITAQAGVTRQQGSPLSNSQIATVNDDNQAENTLSVTVNGSSSATNNGVTVSNIVVTPAGVVTADVVADCSATAASFTLRVTDSTGAFNEAALNVAVTANSAPTVGDYPNASLTPGGGTTVAPNTAPADNGSIISATVTTTGFTGTLSVDSTTGVVTINNADPYGAYTVVVKFTDNCLVTTTKQFTLEVVDETPPDTTITANPPNPSNSTGASFSFTGTDTGGSGVASFECKLDAGSFAACLSPQTYSGLADGSHTFQVRAKDAAGNADPSPASYTWTIDTQQPTVTINQAAGQPDPAVGSGAVIHFTAVFNEPISGFGNAPTDVVLSGTAGATTAVVNEIAPFDNTTFDIAVSGMTQGGTVTASIPNGAAQDAAGNGNAASTSTDNTVTYTPNRPPVASPDGYSTNEDAPLAVAAPGVLGNDSDPDPGNTLTAVLVSAPTHAQSFALNANGSFNYTPAANYNGSDSFSYKARDNNNADSSPVTVTIAVNPVNDAPSFVSGGNVTVAEDSGAYNAAWASAISKGPANESGQALAFIITGNSNPALFSAAPAIAPNGALSFTPAANASGSAIITVVLMDNGGTANGGADTSAPVSFTINVTPVNDAPVVTVAAGGSCGGSGGTANLIVSDVDTPAGSLTLTSSSSNTAVVPNSNVVFGGSGANRTITINPISRSTIQNSVITITVSDGQGGTSTSTVNVISGTNKSDTINGTSGADMIFGGNSDDTINAGAGNDLVCGGNSGDTINGGDGDDTLNGENGDDIIIGGNGNDILIGENGTDTLTGGAGADFFSGGNSGDTFTDFNPAQGDTTDNTLAFFDGVFKTVENWAAD